MAKIITICLLFLAATTLCSCGSIWPPRVEGGKVSIEKHDRVGPVQGGYFEVVIQPPAETLPVEPVVVNPPDRVGPNRVVVQPPYKRPWWDWCGVTVPKDGE